MNILFSFPLRIGRIGIGMTAWHQLNSLSKAGIKIHLLAGSVEKKLSNIESVHTSLHRFGFKIPISLIGNERAINIHDNFTSDYLIKNADSINAVHCWPSGCKKTLMTAKKLGIPSFLERPSSYTPHVLSTMYNTCKELNFELNNKHYAFLNQKKIDLEKSEFDLADYLLCPSPYALKMHSKGGIPDSKLLLHQYGYDPHKFYPLSDPIKMNDKIRGLYVGELNPIKGIHLALEAWFNSNLYKNGKLTICGNIIPGFKSKIQKWLDHPSIEYLGFCKNISQYMQNSHFIILPSFSEGSSLVTYEARACGCCLVVSESTGAYCKHGVTGLLHKTNNIDEITEHLKYFIDKPDLIERIRKESLAEIRNWTWDKAAERLIYLYNEHKRKK